jgi:hypothetical protein
MTVIHRVKIDVNNRLTATRGTQYIPLRSAVHPGVAAPRGVLNLP